MDLTTHCLKYFHIFSAVLYIKKLILFLFTIKVNFFFRGGISHRWPVYCFISEIMKMFCCCCFWKCKFLCGKSFQNVMNRNNSFRTDYVLQEQLKKIIAVLQIHKCAPTGIFFGPLVIYKITKIHVWLNENNSHQENPLGFVWDALMWAEVP